MRNLIFATVALSVIFGLLQVFCVGLTNDTDVIMQQSLLLWHGAGIYTRVILVNAPFNLMVYAPLAAFAAYMHFSPSVLLHGFAFLVCVMSLLSLNQALKQHAVPEEDRGVWCAAAALLLFVVPPIFGVFADRDHLLFAFAMPWILQMLLCLRPLPYTALLAAIGFCMRPHNIILFAALTVVGGPKEWSLRERVLSVSSSIISAVLGAYALTVLVFFPAYITDIVPMALLMYGAYQAPLIAKLKFSSPFIVLTLAGLSKFIKSSERTWYGFFFAVVVTFFLNSGWLYTFYWLVAALALIYAAPLCSPFKASAQEDRLARMMLAVLLFGVFGVGSVYLGKNITATRESGYSIFHHPLLPALRADLRAATGRRFILLSPTLWTTDIEPFNGQPESAPGFEVLWPLFWLYDHGSDPHFSEALRFTTAPLLRAFVEYPDAPVIVDKSPALHGHGSPEGVVLELLERDARVKTAFSGYMPEREIDYCSADNTVNCRFEVWRRRTGGH